MSRKKKEIVEEVVTPMNEDAMNPPVEDGKIDDVSIVNESVKTEDVKVNISSKKPILKKVQCGASLINVRDGAEGNVLFTVRNNSNVLVEEDVNGWCKIVGYVKSDLISEL